MSWPLDRTLSAGAAWWLALAVWAAVLCAIFISKVVEPRRHTIYPILASAGREWEQGFDPYQWSPEKSDLDKYRYAPVVTVAMAPLARLPDWLGGTLWHALNAAVFLIGVVTFAREVWPGAAALSKRTSALLAFLLLPLSVPSLNNGQPNALVIGCLLFGAAAVVRARWNLAAASLAVPVLFKVYPIAVVLLIALAQPRRLGWRVALAVGVGLLLPFACQQHEFVAQAYGSWIDQVASDTRRDVAPEFGYRDFFGLARVLGFTFSTHVYELVQLATALLLAGTVVRGRQLGWKTNRLVRIAVDLGCCWVILFGPATESCTYTQLAPTLAFAALEAWQDARNTRSRWLIVCVLAAFAASLLGVWSPFGRPISSVCLPAGALLLFGERLSRIYWPSVRTGTNKSTLEWFSQTA
jgi:hypothetical protein